MAWSTDANSNCPAGQRFSDCSRIGRMDVPTPSAVDPCHGARRVGAAAHIPSCEEAGQLAVDFSDAGLRMYRRTISVGAPATGGEVARTPQVIAKELGRPPYGTTARAALQAVDQPAAATVGGYSTSRRAWSSSPSISTSAAASRMALPVSHSPFRR